MSLRPIRKTLHDERRTATIRYRGLVPAAGADGARANLAPPDRLSGCPQAIRGEKSSSPGRAWQAVKVCGRPRRGCVIIRYTAAMARGLKNRTKRRLLMDARLSLCVMLALSLMAGCQQSARIDRPSNATREASGKI